MRIDDDVHRAGSWRISDIAADFRLEDVWALPATGRADDFPLLLQVLHPTGDGPGSWPSRALWAIRDLLGRGAGLGRVVRADGEPPRPLPIPGSTDTSVVQRLPADLRGTADDVVFDRMPLRPLYRTPDEFAAEIANSTMHGVMHLAWAPIGGDRYQGQLAVYVLPRGFWGRAYMVAIRPFRYWIVYPEMMRQIERRWRDVVPH